MNSSAVDPKEIRSPIFASWFLLIATCVLAAIPYIGFLSWIIGGVTVTIAIILGIVAISKGGTWSGIFVLLAALIVVPLIIVFAPIVSSLITSAILEEKGAAKIEMNAESADMAAEEAVEAAEATDAGAAVSATAETAVEPVEGAESAADDSTATPAPEAPPKEDE